MKRQHLEVLETRTLMAATLENGVLKVVGTNAADAITLSLDQTLNIVADINDTKTTFDPAQVNTITIDALAGDDVVTNNVNRATTINGGTGNDTLNGGDAIEQFLGDAGNDVIDGNKGNDLADLGAGNDTFIWDPGDGSDTFDGGDGFDTLRFNGSAGDEIMEATAVGNRTKFTRNLGNIVMDAGSTEKLDVRALGGADSVTIGDLRATPTTQVFVDGGEGNDTLVGGPRRDTFVGGLGEDELRGNSDIDVLNGASDAGDDNQPDRILAGSHNDFVTFGDGDTFDLGAGSDSLIFNGTNRSDSITVNADADNGTPIVSFLTNRGTKSAQLANAEIITVNAGSGNDIVVMSEAAGLLWRANFNGGSGNDLLVGGSLNDILRGETGSDVLIGQAGIDALDAGSGKNTIVQ